MNYREEMDEGAVFLEPAYLDAAIVGCALVGSHEVLVYSFAKLAEAFAANEGWDHDSAVEWVEYNTLRALPYMGEQAPIVMYEP